MTSIDAIGVTRRHAAVTGALSGAALVVLGYASGWGLTLPVAGTAAGSAVPASPAAVPTDLPAVAQHYSASGPLAGPMTGPAPAAMPLPTPAATPTPSTPSAPSPTATHHSSPPPTGHGASRPACTGVQASLSALISHVEAGHLEESPAQQVADLLDLDQYAKTHTTLVADLLAPLVGGGEDALAVLLRHVDAGHLEESPSRQAQDLIATDAYVKTHTVLIESLLKPLVGDGGC